MNRISAKSELLAAAQFRAMIDKAKSDWLDQAMAKVLPKEVFEQCMSGDANDRLRVQRYMVRNNIRLVDEPNRSALVVDGKVITEMTVEVKEGKVNILTRDNPEPEATI
jgi:hypothetical protein